MTNIEMLADIKHYIDFRLDDFAKGLKAELKNEIVGELSKKIDERTNEILDSIAQSVIPRIESCEHRLDKLEVATR
jgi:hypothetical protein